MTLPDILVQVTSLLERERIPYMVTGSLATAYHGTPRATQDIDIVLDPDAGQLRRLIAGFPPSRYYADEVSAMQALRSRGQFNLIDSESGWKIDFIIRHSRPFSHAEFARRQQVTLGGVTLVMATAEDVLIAKLEWAKLGESDRQLEDVAGLLRVSGKRLDLPYVERWVTELDLAREWNRAREKASLD